MILVLSHTIIDTNMLLCYIIYNDTVIMLHYYYIIITIIILKETMVEVSRRAVVGVLGRGHILDIF